jgi:bacterial regulatory helix-turn-helix protein, lysR family
MENKKDFSDPTFKQLESLFALYQCGSSMEAARYLGVQSSYVRSNLRALEAKWGKLAVSHKGTPMVVVPRVEKAMPHIEIILNELKKAKEALGVD